MMYVCVVELCCDVCVCVVELCCDVCVYWSCVVMMYVCVVELCCDDVFVCGGAVL